MVNALNSLPIHLSDCFLLLLGTNYEPQWCHQYAGSQTIIKPAVAWFTVARVAPGQR